MSEGRDVRLDTPIDGVIAEVRHPNGKGTRLHTYMSTTPRKHRVWVVGYGLDERWIALGGANCHKSIESAVAAFVAEVVRQERSPEKLARHDRR